MAELLAVPTFAQRLVERDVSRGTARRLSIVASAGASAVMLVSLLSRVKDWGSQHKVAWSCLWKAAARMLNMHPRVFDRLRHRFVRPQ